MIYEIETRMLSCYNWVAFPAIFSQGMLVSELSLSILESHLRVCYTYKVLILSECILFLDFDKIDLLNDMLGQFWASIALT